MSEPKFPLPDLGDPAAHKAYRQELRQVARPIAAAGFLLCAAGVAAYFSPIVTGWWWLFGIGASDVGLGTAILGWVLLIVAFFRRNLHHRRRLRGEIPGPVQR